MRQKEKKRRSEKGKKKVNPIDEKYYDHQQGPIRFPYFPNLRSRRIKVKLKGIFSRK